MKSTGIVRQLDPLNRLVIPKEIVKTQNLEGAAMGIYTNGNQIILQRYNPGCHCCGKMDNLVKVQDLPLCQECIDKYTRAMAMLIRPEVKGVKAV